MKLCPPSEEISAFVDEELSEAERAVVAAHLEECGACKRLVTEIQETSASLSSVASDDLARRKILRSILWKQSWWRESFEMARWGAASLFLGLALSLAVNGYLFFKSQEVTHSRDEAQGISRSGQVEVLPSMTIDESENVDSTGGEDDAKEEPVSYVEETVDEQNGNERATAGMKR